MAYSNITPPTLPEYDSALYSHYVLEFEYENGSDNWFAVSLRYSSTPFTYDGTAVTNAGEHHLQTYGSGTGEWTYWGTLTEMSIAPGTTSTGGYRRIWTNHNILDGSGNVWLAANTATPAEANLDRLSIMKSKLAGLIMAWCAPVRQFPQREPVAFLYGHVAKEGETPTHTINGVGYVGAVLPNIGSIYTREVRNNFPYAFIYYHTEGRSFYVLECHSEEPGVASKSNLTLIPYDTNNKGQFMSTVWGEGKTNSFDDPIEFTGALLSVTKGIIWTNFDLRYRGTNEVYFPKSPDPIPIYE